MDTKAISWLKSLSEFWKYTKDIQEQTLFFRGMINCNLGMLCELFVFYSVDLFLLRRSFVVNNIGLVLGV
jgi:hypothetical protein